MDKQKADQFESFKDLVLREYEKGNVVVLGFDGPMVCPLDKFVEQPIEGILYDLNRGEEVVLTFIKDEKWVNDYAVAKVIRKLKQEKYDLITVLKKALDSAKYCMSNDKFNEEFEQEILFLEKHGKKNI